MISNRVKRNVWLVLAVMSVGAVVDRAIRVAEGTVEWWNLVSAIVITAFCVKFYLCCRREVKTVTCSDVPANDNLNNIF